MEGVTHPAECHDSGQESCPEVTTEQGGEKKWQ